MIFLFNGFFFRFQPFLFRGALKKVAWDIQEIPVFPHQVFRFIDKLRYLCYTFATIPAGLLTPNLKDNSVNPT